MKLSSALIRPPIPSSHGPPNYIAYRKDRNEHGGGVLLAHKDDFTLSQPTFLKNITGESVWTKVHSHTSKRPTYVCSCYIGLPSTRSAVTDLEHLRDALSLIFAHHRHTQPLIYIAGDFNLGDIFNSIQCLYSRILHPYKVVIHV